MIKSRQPDRGYSLVELLVATVLFTIIAGTIFSLLFSAQLRYSSESGLTTAFQQANVAIDQITRDIHSAGYPRPSSFAPGVALNNPQLMALPFSWSPGYPNAPCTVNGSCGAVPGDYDLILETDTGDGNGVVLSAPVINFWSFTSAGNTYSFELSALTNGHVQADMMSFTGTGTLFATGYDPTPATFSMNGTGENFAFQLSFVTNTATGNNVPDTGPTILLLSCSMVALLVCWRRLERPALAAQTRKR